MVEGTRKKNCPAKLMLRELQVFPDHRTDVNVGINIWQKSQMKKAAFTQLRTGIADGSARSVGRCFIQAPTKHVHKHHDLESEMPMPLHKVKIAKIYDFVSQGIGSVREVKHILKDCVKNEPWLAI